MSTERIVWRDQQCDLCRSTEHKVGWHGVAGADEDAGEPGMVVDFCSECYLKFGGILSEVRPIIRPDEEMTDEERAATARAEVEAEEHEARRREEEE